MKKFLFLLVFVFIYSSSFAQIIVNKRVVKKGKKLVMVKSTGEIRTNDKIIIEKIAVAINPLYKAPIIFLLGPSLTKKVPAIDVTIHDPPIASG